MAANIPAKLKQAGITPFVVRAAQLESAKPVITYWCQYWVVNQILAKQLHNADEDCLQFTTNLMDKLEQTKSEHANNDAILDDVAGQAYVEQFAQETFERALRPLKANKVTQQTANTFEAAATFFQLFNIWGTPDAETLGKIKYSKWNAARILKAIKEGKDPNESNPKQEEKEEESPPTLDPNDPEVQMIGSSQPRPVTVEDVPDDRGKPQSPTSEQPHLRVQALVSAPTSPLPPTAPAPEQVSPIVPPEAPEGYFPPGPPAELTRNLPPCPDEECSPYPRRSDSPLDSWIRNGQEAARNLPSAPRDFYQAPPPKIPVAAREIPPQHGQPYAPPAAQHYPPHPPQQQYGGPAGTSYNTDEMAQAQAQKHAKWAISALNFEDVPTAVRELQAALAVLGAR